MSDFLSNLIARSFADQPVIRPRLPSRFESAVAEPFSEVQSVAPGTTAAEKLSPVVPSVPNLFETEKPATGKAIADATVSSPAEKQPLPTNLSVTPVPPVAIPSTRSDDGRVVEFKAKKPVVPITSALAGKNQGHTAKTPLFQKSSERSSFQPRSQNPFSPAEPRPSAPAIHVTIGRVEVRAIQSAAPLPKPSKPAPPKLSLDDYLQKRDGGAR